MEFPLSSSGNYAHIYVHLPFCEVICHYCDFYTARAKGARHDDLFRALNKQAASVQEHLAPKLTALYFGGGTPSESPPQLLANFISLFRERFSSGTEITLEANPGNISESSVRVWKDAGITRLSIGIQSLDDTILKRVGRIHSAADALRATTLALKVFDNITIDLMYGIPGQNLTSSADDATKLTALGIQHISAYHLTLKNEHFLYSKLPGDEEALTQIENLARAVSERGFHHYEISNFSKRGFESKNNSNYWRGGPYLALGPSAHGYDGDKMRWKNISDWEKYITMVDSNSSIVEERETLTPAQKVLEFIFTGLRLETGVSFDEFERRNAYKLQEHKKNVIDALISEGLALSSDSHLVLSFRGRMLADSIVLKLVD